MGVVLHICVTCRGDPPSRDRVPPGRRLAQAVLALTDAAVRLTPVACMNLCAQGCNAALTGADGRTRVAGGLSPADAAAVVEWARGGAMPGRCIAEIPPSHSQDTA